MTIELIVFKRGLSGIWPWVNFFHFLISAFLERKKLSRNFTVFWNNRRLIGGCLYSLVLARGLFLKRFPPLINTSPARAWLTLRISWKRNWPASLMLLEKRGISSVNQSLSFGISYVCELPLISRTSMCVVKTKHMWELPLITWIFMCVVFTTHVWFLSNTEDLPKCLVKTTHVCENPNIFVYFQIQGGCFCICIFVQQISLKYLILYMCDMF